MPGISGIILGIGRIVGETAALMFTSGSVADVALNPMDSGRTLAVHMYNLLNEAWPRGRPTPPRGGAAGAGNRHQRPVLLCGEKIRKA